VRGGGEEAAGTGGEAGRAPAAMENAHTKTVEEVLGHFGVNESTGAEPGAGQEAQGEMGFQRVTG